MIYIKLLRGGGGGEGRLTTQWLAALRVKVFKAVVFKLFMAVVLSGCQCWSQREEGGRRGRQVRCCSRCHVLSVVRGRL